MHRGSSRILDSCIKGCVVLGPNSNGKTLQERSNIEGMHSECMIYINCIVMYWVCEEDWVISLKKIKGWVTGRARYLRKRRYESKIDGFVYCKHWQVTTRKLYSHNKVSLKPEGIGRSSPVDSPISPQLSQHLSTHQLFRPGILSSQSLDAPSPHLRHLHPPRRCQKRDT